MTDTNAGAPPADADIVATLRALIDREKGSRARILAEVRREPPELRTYGRGLVDGMHDAFVVLERVLDGSSVEDAVLDSIFGVPLS